MILGAPRDQGEAINMRLPLAFGSLAEADELEDELSGLAERLADLEASRFFLGLERLLQTPDIVEIWYRPHHRDLCVRVAPLEPGAPSVSAWEFISDLFTEAEEAPERREDLLARGALLQSFQSQADALMSRFEQRSGWRWGERFNPFSSPLPLIASPATELARACRMPEIAALMERQSIARGLLDPAPSASIKSL